MFKDYYMSRFEDYYTSNEVGHLLGMPRASVRQWANKRKVKSLKATNRLFYPKKDIDKIAKEIENIHRCEDCAMICNICSKSNVIKKKKPTELDIMNATISICKDCGSPCSRCAFYNRRSVV